MSQFDVTDEQIDRIADDYEDDQGRIRVDKVFEFARAILALRFEHGYALKDHQIAALVNRLRDIAIEFHAHQSLRERIAHEVVPVLKPPRPAAVPMTEEQIDAEIANRAILVRGMFAIVGYDSLRQFARTIEAHHGITAQAGEGGV